MPGQADGGGRVGVLLTGDAERFPGLGNDVHRKQEDSSPQLERNNQVPVIVVTYRKRLTPSLQFSKFL